ncbi:MAG: hypothetical protein K6A89_03805, partial [Treponema sp.]|nr:hypothetical protein [Treponema sp.]
MLSERRLHLVSGLRRNLLARQKSLRMLFSRRGNEMKSILTNTVKITAASVLAILCAQILKLDFAVSAGIVAILSVQPTKKE